MSGSFDALKFRELLEQKGIVTLGFTFVQIDRTQANEGNYSPKNIFYYLSLAQSQEGFMVAIRYIDVASLELDDASKLNFKPGENYYRLDVNDKDLDRILKGKREAQVNTKTLPKIIQELLKVEDLSFFNSSTVFNQESIDDKLNIDIKKIERLTQLRFKGLNSMQEEIEITVILYSDGSNKTPRVLLVDKLINDGNNHEIWFDKEGIEKLRISAHAKSNIFQEALDRISNIDKLKEIESSAITKEYQSFKDSLLMPMVLLEKTIDSILIKTKLSEKYFRETESLAIISKLKIDDESLLYEQLIPDEDDHGLSKDECFSLIDVITSETNLVLQDFYEICFENRLEHTNEIESFIEMLGFAFVEIKMQIFDTLRGSVIYSETQEEFKLLVQKDHMNIPRGQALPDEIEIAFCKLLNCHYEAYLRIKEAFESIYKNKKV